jgi:hypothetical protein
MYKVQQNIAWVISKKLKKSLGGWANLINDNKHKHNITYASKHHK